MLTVYTSTTSSSTKIKAIVAWCARRFRPPATNANYPYSGGLLDIFNPSLLFNRSRSVRNAVPDSPDSPGCRNGFSDTRTTSLRYDLHLVVNRLIADALNGDKLNNFGEPFSGQSVDISVAPTPEPLQPGELMLFLGTGIARPRRSLLVDRFSRSLGPTSHQMRPPAHSAGRFL